MFHLKTKEEIRKKIKESQTNLDSNTHMSLSKSIHEKVFATKDYDKCNYLFTYLSFGKEVDTVNLIKQALLDGKHVFIPKVNGFIMEFYNITSIKGLKRSNFGILEPDENIHISYEDWSDDMPLTSNVLNKMMIMPGLGFDIKGHRIGYGGGYYDKYLASNKQNEFNKIALAFDFQIFNQIPSEKHDVTVDKIITPTQIIHPRI